MLRIQEEESLFFVASHLELSELFELQESEARAKASRPREASPLRVQGAPDWDFAPEELPLPRREPDARCPNLFSKASTKMFSKLAQRCSFAAFACCAVLLSAACSSSSTSSAGGAAGGALDSAGSLAGKGLNTAEQVQAERERYSKDKDAEGQDGEEGSEAEGKKDKKAKKK